MREARRGRLQGITESTSSAPRMASSLEKRSGRLGGAAETSKELADWCRLQRKNLNILGLPKKKEWPQCHKESSWQVRQAASVTRKRNRAVCPDHQIMRWERVKVSESQILAR